MFEASSIEEDEGESEGAFGEGFGSWMGWTFLERREEDLAMFLLELLPYPSWMGVVSRD